MVGFYNPTAVGTGFKSLDIQMNVVGVNGPQVHDTSAAPRAADSTSVCSSAIHPRRKPRRRRPPPRRRGHFDACDPHAMTASAFEDHAAASPGAFAHA